MQTRLFYCLKKMMLQVYGRLILACPSLRMPGRSCNVVDDDGAGQLIEPNSKGYLYGSEVITIEAGFGNSASEEEHLVVMGCRRESASVH